MVALRMNQRATKTTIVVNRSRSRLLSGHGYVHDTVIPKNYGLATWRALRVLIVDHQQDRADRLSARIEGWGRAAQVAHSGQAALILAADEHPDVVLLSLELPSMDGRHVAKQLRLDAPQSDCLIIALSDWADDERRRQCSASGIDLLLVAPVGPSLLDVLLELEWIRINRQRAAEAGF